MLTYRQDYRMKREIQKYENGKEKRERNGERKRCKCHMLKYLLHLLPILKTDCNVISLKITFIASTFIFFISCNFYPPKSGFFIQKNRSSYSQL